jgi:hypothetical protein
MCFLECFCKRPKTNIPDNLTAALVEPERRLNYPVLHCQLCNLTDEVSVLLCKHALCKGCVETQKLYINGPCLVCEHKHWSALVPYSS